METFIVRIIQTYLNHVYVAFFKYSSGSPANHRRYRKLIVLSYGFPAFVTLCTLIAEYAAPECASFRPRFGEEGCFFAG
jgi:hypothetical protein